MAYKFRQERFYIENSKATCVVYQRPREAPVIETNHFDGSRLTATGAEAFQKALMQAIQLAHKWQSEGENWTA